MLISSAIQKQYESLVPERRERIAARLATMRSEIESLVDQETREQGLQDSAEVEAALAALSHTDFALSQDMSMSLNVTTIMRASALTELPLNNPNSAVGGPAAGNQLRGNGMTN